MVYNSYIKCQVCDSITRIRLQVGKLKSHPIVVTCGKCGTSLCGKVDIGQDVPSLNFAFDNADIIENPTLNKSDFLVECSGEFPVKKQCEDNASKLIDISPFIRQMVRMGGTTDFYEAIYLLNNTASNWKDCKKIFDLYKNKSEYLIPEIKKHLGIDIPSLDDHSDIIEALHLLEVEIFFKALNTNLIKHYSYSVDILRIDSQQMKALIDFLNTHDGYHLEELQLKIYQLYDEFIKLYPALIPAISLQYCKDETINFDEDGSTTSTFDTVNDFYKNLYESFAQLLVIPVALNNIKYRSNLNAMAPKINPKTSSLEAFIGLTKANRYHFYLDNEFYTAFTNVLVNKDIRNAIGHNDTEYDTATQQITYYPNPKDKSKKSTEYLLEFENEIVHMFQGILTISEYLYRLRELELAYNGNEKVVLSLSQLVDVYDPCPCGSGKKLKFCHGKR